MLSYALKSEQDDLILCYIEQFVSFQKLSLNSLQLQFSPLNNRGNVFYIIKRCFREVEYILFQLPHLGKATMNFLIKYVLHFATHWQLNKTLRYPFLLHPLPPLKHQSDVREDHTSLKGKEDV